MKSEASSENEKSAEFMLKEYGPLYTLMAGESSQAEQRVNFFLTIASGAIGAVIVLSQISNINAATQGVLVVLLLFGLTTLNRLNVRVVHQRAYSRLLNEIQNYFAAGDPRIADYFNVRRKCLNGRKANSEYCHPLSAGLEAPFQS